MLIGYTLEQTARLCDCASKQMQILNRFPAQVQTLNRLLDCVMVPRHAKVSQWILPFHKVEYFPVYIIKFNSKTKSTRPYCRGESIPIPY